MRKEKKIKNKKKWKLIIALLLLFILFSVLGIYYITYCNLISKYNETASKYNSVVNEYKIGLNNAAVANIEGMPTDIKEVELLNKNFKIVLNYWVKGATKKIISEGEQYMVKEIDNLHDASLIIKQITCPEQGWVMSRLREVDVVKDMQEVDYTNNPDGMLGKEGGYQTCIYFTTNLFDDNDIPGRDIVAKGTDAGGAVEVYKTLQEAKERCDYLSGFDDTILYSGSYALIGTMVIRTSYIFEDKEQNKITDKIVKAFTVLQ